MQEAKHIENNFEGDHQAKLQSFRSNCGTTKFPFQGEETHKARKALPISSSF